MKSLKLVRFIFVIITSSISAQTPHFYYYKGEKQYLNFDTKHIFVSVSDTTHFASPDIMNQLII